uniref:prepilin-type N-terminal cleavage/methylation domain-containing protein n=1 Tax=Candidatus Scatousia sp. TaxID=3085663 RepID=UPI004028D210
MVLRGGGRLNFLSGQGFTGGSDSESSYPEQVSGSFGFTLAEVLITLGIIGIVAAMTLPAITANTRKSETSARLKKFNSMMAQAITLSESVNGDSIYWQKEAASITEDENDDEIYDNDLGPKATYKFLMKYIAPYIKYYRIEESVPYPNPENPEKFSKIYFADGSEAYVKNGACIDFYYDVNGERKPNRYGYDIFIFALCPWHSSTYFGNTNRKWGALCTSYTQDRNELIQKKTCPARILELDGWEFKKDYPFRL